jgi:hypothetical protein
MAWTPDEYRQKPKEFDPALAEAIVERVANGETLGELCKDRDMPLPATFLRWVAQDPHLSEQWEEALTLRTELAVDEMLMVANDYDSKRARNRLDARKFHAERMMPGKYGPRAYVSTVAKTEDTAGGIDWGADVRRKLDAMSKRLDEAQVEETKS